MSVDTRSGHRSDGSSPAPSTGMPSIPLPKGGGAIRGIGEKFAANPVTGTGSLQIPIATSPGRAGFGPQLSLSYDSGASNGPFGFGWTLSLPSITRKTERGLPRYEDANESDVFMLSGVEDLVPALGDDGAPLVDDSSVPGQTIVRYRPRIEGAFARIERWTNRVTGETHWRTISRDNVTSLFGETHASRIADAGDATSNVTPHVFSWLISQSYDDKGNAIVYDYVREDGARIDVSQANERNRAHSANCYLKRIRYGNRVSRFVEPDVTLAAWLFEVVFDYDEGHYEALPPDINEPASEQHRRALASSAPGAIWSTRPDPFSSYRSGFEVRTYRRCRRVMMFHHFDELGPEPCLVRSTAFEYADLDYGPADGPRQVSLDEELSHQGSTRFASVIQSVTQSGFVHESGANPVERGDVRFLTYVEKALPPLEFQYSRAVVQDAVIFPGDQSLDNLPAGMHTAHAQWLDLDGEGLSGVLMEQAGAWHFKPNLGGGRLGPVRTVARKPAGITIAGGGYQFLDLGGDGQLDVVALAGPAPGFFERTPDDDWDSFRAFAALPNVAWNDPNLRFVDVDGDGHADVLIAGQEEFIWYRSLAEAGFEWGGRANAALDEERGPRLMFADGTESVYLADMSGDGLADLVRIRNGGHVCYWPNLGYGRFGAKVTMDGAPVFDVPDQFEQHRIRLADIDGSGTNDIIYLGRDAIRLYFNQSGNRLSAPRRLAPLPHLDDLVSASIVDLLGNGTACLVWSSPLQVDAGRALRYIDLMGGQKPHLLIGTMNNLGAESRVHYVPSTAFYLADERKGRPWKTRLPFPVHVVESVETFDRISGNRFVTSYSYRDGYFDGAEREFRGFALVEQRDTATFEALAGATNVAQESHVPPVLTRTWFHTGAWSNGEQLADTLSPARLTMQEEREAYRALKGSILRQEVYGLDGGERESHPYTVVEQSFAIRLVQPRGARPHAVFSLHPRETTTYNYERSLVPVLDGHVVDDVTAAANPLTERLLDPRVLHTMTLEVDRFGNALKSASVAYGRRFVDTQLPTAADQQIQSTTLVTYTESVYTNGVDSVDNWRTPIPCDVRSYELTGYSPSGASGRFVAGDFVRADPLDTMRLVLDVERSLPYEDVPTTGKERRLVERVVTLFRPDDLGASAGDPDTLLPLGALESLAIPAETYRLALTTGQVADAFGDRVTDAMLDTDAGYVHATSDEGWWIPSGRIYYSRGPLDSALQELQQAHAGFFVPRRYRDAFHSALASTESFADFDDYHLLIVETQDALGNRVSVGERRADDTLDPNVPGNDYRVLQPCMITDPNRNRTALAFDALGLVVASAVMGKADDSSAQGDGISTGFEADLTEAAVARFVVDPRGAAAALLGDATVRTIYSLESAWVDGDPAMSQPSFVATLTRESHASAPVPSNGSRLRVEVSYSDGFGREIQKKVAAADGPVPERDAAGAIILDANGLPLVSAGDRARWLASGWSVMNNRSKIVRQYESFFTDRHAFEFDVRIGVSAILCYDPLDRVVATIHPDHTWEKVVFDAWHQETWDANDTVSVTDPALDADAGDYFRRLATREYLPTWSAQRLGGALGTEERVAAEKATVHAGTPAIAHADPLGRTFLTVAHHRAKFGDGSQPPDEHYCSRVSFDIEGNQRAVLDARDRVVMRFYYDMLGTRLRQSSMEAGEQRMLSDVAGKPLYAWDQRGHRMRTVHDRLRRATETWLSVDGSVEQMVGRSVYGEGVPNAETNNLRGKAVRLCDQAGIVTTDAYDFKGNPLASRRQLAVAYSATLDWSDGAAPVVLQVESYVSRTQYDALNRPIQVVAPHSDRAGSAINVAQPLYDESGHFDRLDVWLGQGAEPATLLDPTTADMPAVRRIEHDARGRRTRIRYGNGVRTSYGYDPLTSRLVAMRTRRNPLEFPTDCPKTVPPGWSGCDVQNLRYSYDAVGNIVSIRDDAQQTVFFRNKRVEPSSAYAYDSLYRLIEASGREHLGQVGGAPIPHSYNDVPRVGIEWGSNDGNAMGRYVETYLYDEVGNFRAMAHAGTDPAHPGWRRTYAHGETSQLEPLVHSNRLTSTTIGTSTETYSTGGDGYDAHGNMLRMPHLRVMQWNYLNQLQMTQRQAVSDLDADGAAHSGERTWYVYDAAGQRVRKVTELAPGEVKDERIYLAGFEVYRRPGTTALERETLHLMDDTQRIAMVETRTSGTEPGVPRQLTRYQVGNHLGSAALELDERASISSYELYTPYGSTSYQAVRSRTETPKRYRYSGKERDEESGLNYHGARYYASWLGRWVNPDPDGVRDGPNCFAYAHCNPVRNVDPDGRETSAAENQLFRDLILAREIQKQDPDAFLVRLADNDAKLRPLMGRFGFRGWTSWDPDDMRGSGIRDFERAAQAWYTAGGKEYLNTEVTGEDENHNYYYGTPLRVAREELAHSVDRSLAVGHAISGANLGLGAIGYGIYGDKGALVGDAVGGLVVIGAAALELQLRKRVSHSEVTTPTTIEQQYFRGHQTSLEPSARLLRGNTRAGFRNEEIQISELRRQGFSILEGQVRASRSGSGKAQRYLDVLAISPAGELVAFELKLGLSRYHPRQRAFDEHMATEGAYLDFGPFPIKLRVSTTLIRTQRPLRGAAP